MKILILGASGYAGTAIKKELDKRNDSIIGTYRTPCAAYETDPSMIKYELENTEQMNQLLLELNPDIVISCLNGDFEQQLKTYKIVINFLSQDENKKFIFLSTANVFDGALETAHYENDIPKAESDYGQFKIQCENLIRNALGENGIIIRIPEIWGMESSRIQKIKKQIEEEEAIPTFQNIFVNYTTNKQIARWIDYIIEKDLKGTFHIGTKELYEYIEFQKELIAALQLGKASYQVLKKFPTKQIQAVLPNRSEIPASLQMSIKDVIDEMKSS